MTLFEREVDEIIGKREVADLFLPSGYHLTDHWSDCLMFHPRFISEMEESGLDGWIAVSDYVEGIKVHKLILQKSTDDEGCPLYSLEVEVTFIDGSSLFFDVRDLDCIAVLLFPLHEMDEYVKYKKKYS